MAMTNSSLSNESSEYHSAPGVLSCTDHLEDKPSTSRANVSALSSTYFSARIESMIENRSAFSNALEFDIQYSKDHWTQLDSLLESEDDDEYSPEADQEYFEELKQHTYWGDFFDDFDDLVVGEKIGEGAQAEIYEAQLLRNDSKSEYYDLVVKVMKKGYALRSLRRQWPLGMLNFARSSCDLRKNPSSISGRTLKGSLSWIKGGTLLKDERLKGQFAFVMDRWWGDLRKLIDFRMQRNNNQGPPFNKDQVLDLMRDIAWDMESLHNGYSMILHRDLKASNVLIFAVDVEASDQKIFNALVIDYECSMGVVGTGFWRAPEILQQLKDGICGSKLKFTSKADVYSYGMTCYEIVTGHMPFEELSASNFDHILSGYRPELPDDIDPLVKEIITRCWLHDPSQRPNFKSIHTLIRQAINRRRQSGIILEPCRVIVKEKLVKEKLEQQMKECMYNREEWERKWQKWARQYDWPRRWEELKEWCKLKGRSKYWDKWVDLKKSNFEWHSWEHRWEEWEVLQKGQKQWKVPKQWKVSEAWTELLGRDGMVQEKREQKWWKEWEEWTSFVHECTLAEQQPVRSAFVGSW